MSRRLLNLPTVLSLLLCVAVVVLWVRSRSITDTAGYTGDVTWSAVSVRGRVTLIVSFPASVGKEWRGGWSYRRRAAPPRHAGSAMSQGGQIMRIDGLGFHFAAYRAAPPTATTLGSNVPYGIVGLPDWFLALAFGVPAGVVIVRRVRTRARRRAGLCAGCGYDLRATPGRCPECGTPASVSTSG